MKRLIKIILIFLSINIAVADEVAKPETTTHIELSNTDINRLVCTNGNMNDSFYSKEKSLVITLNGKNAFVKYLIKKQGEKLTYVTKNTEMHIVCAGEVYTIIAIPKEIPSVTVRLQTKLKQRIKKNIADLGALDHEERILQIIQNVYRNELPESYSSSWEKGLITKATSNSELKKLLRVVNIIKTRTHIIEGVGLAVDEYSITATQDVRLKETDFMDTVFGDNIVAITVYPPLVKNRNKSRLIVVRSANNDL